MIISLSWLKQYVDFDLSPQELADKLTMIGLEVDSITDRYEYLKTVITGKIISITPHPNADKLTVCNVNTGGNELTIVCGADNINISDIVPVALPGTVFPDGFVLKETEIRGQLSQGMLCSQKELGLGDDHAGIMILEKNTKQGLIISDVLNISDMVFEIGLTPNRSDCTSIIGIAREVAAITNSKVIYPEINIIEEGQDINTKTSVKIEAEELCPRYAAALLTDIKVSKSPFWLKDRLSSIGLRSINNIVDITNYVMMETGQPLHAFDFNLLEDKKIVVRKANMGEKFFTLDNQERILTDETLMICDGKKPVAIGGVMGGLNSEIIPETNTVLLESAYFNPVSIRKTSKYLGLSTDASYRFERGANPEGTIFALKRAAQLMVEICGAKMAKGVIDEYPAPIKKNKIDLSLKKTHKLLGIFPDALKVKSCLNKIEFQVDIKDNDKITIIPPPYRTDISRPEDIMEEVARLIGYNTIPTTFAKASVIASKPNFNIEIKNYLKNILAGFGFCEVINYSFISALSADRIRLNESDYRRKNVKLLNPLTEEQNVMRTSLLPGIIENLRTNTFNHDKTIKIFEIGKIFIDNLNDDLPKEEEIISGLLSGKRSDLSWYSKEEDCDFFDLKGIVEAFLNKLKISNIIFSKPINYNDYQYLTPGYIAEIKIDNEIIGVSGQIHSEVIKNYDIKQDAYIFEINFEKLLKFIPSNINYIKLPKYPSTYRDLTMIIDKNIEVNEIFESIKKNEQQLVESILLFDVYEGKPVPAGKKSVSLRLIYRSQNETLKDEIINQLHSDLCSFAIKKFNADLPG